MESPENVLNIEPYRYILLDCEVRGYLELGNEIDGRVGGLGGGGVLVFKH